MLSCWWNRRFWGNLGWTTAVGEKSVWCAALCIVSHSGLFLSTFLGRCNSQSTALIQYVQQCNYTAVSVCLPLSLIGRRKYDILLNNTI